MDLNQYFEEHVAQDPSWQIARSIAEKRLRITPHDWRIIRQAWQGQLEVKELLRMLGFTHFNVKSLLRAATTEPNQSEEDAPPPTVEQALNLLGVRYSILVLTISYIAANTLRTRPPPLWKAVFKEMMTNVEIGYRFGNRAVMLGFEGGALMGFALSVGKLLLLAHDGRLTAKLIREDKFDDPALQMENFGCQDYQITAFVMQQMGFGTPVSFGALMALSNLDLSKIDITENDETYIWRAALLWTKALRDGRNYPAEVKVRSVFPELTPPRDRSSSNRILEILYTEVARVKNNGSNWVWHLPRGSYDYVIPSSGATY